MTIKPCSAHHLYPQVMDADHPRHHDTQQSAGEHLTNRLTHGIILV